EGQRRALGGQAVAHHAGDGQLGPSARQLGLQCGGQQRLVLGDQGAGSVVFVHGVGRGRVTVASVPPSGPGASSSVPAAPYSVASRSRTWLRPKCVPPSVG